MEFKEWLEERIGISRIQTIPEEYFGPGIYFLFWHGEVVYIGQSRCVIRRVAAHKRFDRVAFIECPEEHLLEVEAALIRKLCPIGNTMVKRAEENKLRRVLGIKAKLRAKQTKVVSERLLAARKRRSPAPLTPDQIAQARARILAREKHGKRSYRTRSANPPSPD